MVKRSFVSTLFLIGILVLGIFFYSQSQVAKMARFQTKKISVNNSGFFVQPELFESYVKDADLVVEGVIKEFRPAVWTTPNHLPPTDPNDLARDPNIQLRTPIVIDVKKTRKGNASGELIFAQSGGETTDYIVTDESSQPTLSIGDTVILFLKSSRGNPLFDDIATYYPILHFIVRGQKNDKLLGNQYQFERGLFESQLRSMKGIKND